MDFISILEDRIIGFVRDHFTASGSDVFADVSPYRGEAGTADVLDVLENLVERGPHVLVGFTGLDWNDNDDSDALWDVNVRMSLYVCAKNLSDQEQQARKGYALVIEAAKALRDAKNIVAEEAEFSMMVESVEPGSIVPVVNVPGLVVFQLVTNANIKVLFS